MRKVMNYSFNRLDRIDIVYFVYFCGLCVNENQKFVVFEILHVLKIRIKILYTPSYLAISIF